MLMLLQSRWPQVLWGILLVAVLANVTYLLWPESPQTLVLSPHPATFHRYTETMPVLVEREPGSSDMLMVQPVPHSKPQVVKTLHRTKPKSPDGKKAFTGVLNINTASAEQLQQLPGIGPAMAKRIVQYRTEHGGFQAPQELDQVSGIGEKKLAQLLPHVSTR